MRTRYYAEYTFSGKCSDGYYLVHTAECPDVRGGKRVRAISVTGEPSEALREYHAFVTINNADMSVEVRGHSCMFSGGE